MSLNGLEATIIGEAYEAAVAEPGGWFLLKYISRDEIDILAKGKGGLVEIRDAVAGYTEKSPLYGFIRYRRRNVLIKYVPDGTSRLIQARVSVHFQSVVDRFAPHDTIFSIKSPTELKDTTLSSACSLHAASGSTSSSTSSTNKHRLGEIAEDEEESSTIRARSEIITPTETPRGPVSPRETLYSTSAQSKRTTILRNGQPADPMVSPTSPKSPSDESSLGSGGAAAQHNSKSSMASVPTIVSYSQASDDGARFSTNSARPSMLDLYDSYPYKPKVKLGPRPSTDQTKRPHTSGSAAPSGDGRPVSTLPPGIRLASRKGQSNRPKSQHSDAPVNGFVPIPPVPATLPSVLPSRPTTSPGKILSPAATPPSRARNAATAQEKQRLMKAMQLRKRQIAAKTQEAETPTSEKSGQNAESEQQETASVGLSEDSPIVNKTDVTDEVHVEKEKDQMVEKEGGEIEQEDEEEREGEGEEDKEDKADKELRKSGSSPISGPESLDMQSTQPSSVSEVADEHHPISHIMRSDAPTVDACETQEEGSSGAEPAEVLHEEPLAETQFKRDSKSLVNKNFATAGPDTTTDTNRALEEPVEVTEKQQIPSNDDIIAINQPKGDIVPEKDLRQEVKRSSFGIPSNAIEIPKSVPDDLSTESPSLSQQTPNHPTIITQLAFGNKKQLPGESDHQPIRERRRGLINPIKTDIPEGSDGTLNSDDSAMDELHSATVQAAKPIPYGKSPKTPILSVFSSAENLGHGSPKARTSPPNRLELTTSDPRSNRFSTEIPVIEMARSVSASHLNTFRSQQAAPVGLAKKVNVSSGISQRIKALEARSVSAASPSPGTTEISPNGSPSFQNARNNVLLAPSRSASTASHQGPAPGKLSTAPSPSPSPTPTPEQIKPPKRVARIPGEKSESEKAKSAQKPMAGSISVTARIVRDTDTSAQDTSEELYQSSITIEHEKPQPTLISPIPIPTSEQSGLDSSSNDSASRVSSPPNSSRRSSVSRRKSEPRSPSATSSFSSDEKKEGRRSSTKARLLRRMSSISSQSRKSIANAISPTLKEEGMTFDVPEARKPSLAVQITSREIGEVNVQFPDNLLWKRRRLNLDDQGNIVLTASRADEYTKTAPRRFRLSEFLPPFAPDQDQQELPFSVVLDHLDGGTLQCACENANGQAALLHALHQAHNSVVA